MNNKGAALDHLSNYKYAIEEYDKALKIDPNYVDALSKKGKALNNLGKYQEAIEWYDKTLNIDPNNVFALNKIVAYLLLVWEKLAQEAIEWYDKAH